MVQQGGATAMGSQPESKSHALLKENIQDLFKHRLLCDLVLISEDKHEVPVRDFGGASLCSVEDI